jgi:hypothetical protein
MRPVYVVRPVDNCGSVEGLVRDRTWAVIEKCDGNERVVDELLTRSQAHAARRGYEAAWDLTLDGEVQA